MERWKVHTRINNYIFIERLSIVYELRKRLLCDLYTENHRPEVYKSQD